MCLSPVRASLTLLIMPDMMVDWLLFLRDWMEVRGSKQFVRVNWSLW